MWHRIFWKTSLVIGTSLSMGLSIIDYNFTKILSTEVLSSLLSIGILLMLLAIAFVMPDQDEETPRTYA